MSIYGDSQEENVWIRRKAKSWLRSGLIGAKQESQLQSATAVEVLQANLFIRLLLFGFTLLCIAAIVGFFLWLTKIQDHVALTVVFLVFGALSYALAEYAVYRQKLYRYGVEEALALSAVAFLCAAAMSSMKNIFWGSDNKDVILAGIAAIGALWLYRRFGFLYAVLIAIFALATVPFHLGLSPTLERLCLLAFFAAAFVLVKLAQAKNDLAFRRKIYDVLQAVLLLAAYLTLNLRMMDLRVQGLSPLVHLPATRPHAGFPPFFYWLSYGFIFLLPVVTIFYGLRRRKRLLIDVGIIMAVVSLVTNKDYLGFVHHAWDAAFLGGLLVGVSLALLRWLARGPGQARFGYTASEIVKPESHGLDLQAGGLAVLTPEAPQVVDSPKVERGGGFSGGGASGGF